jgi:hypothetical protein
MMEIAQTGNQGSLAIASGCGGVLCAGQRTKDKKAEEAETASHIAFPFARGSLWRFGTPVGVEVTIEIVTYYPVEIQRNNEVPQLGQKSNC